MTRFEKKDEEGAGGKLQVAGGEISLFLFSTFFAPPRLSFFMEPTLDAQNPEP